MNNPVLSAYRLVARGGAGLACDKDGLALGAVRLATVRMNAEGLRRCDTRGPGEISRILRAAYEPQPDEVVLRLHQGLRRAAAAIEAGDLGRAGIEAVKLGFPDLTPETMVKLAEINDLEKGGAAWEAEPRIPAGQTGAGRWTTDDEGAPKPVVRPARNGGGVGAERHRPPPRSRNRRRIPGGSTLRDTGGLNPIDSNLLVHIGTATSAFGGFGSAGEFAPPKFLGRLGRAGLLTFAASLLDASVIHSAQDQISKAVTRFGLNASRPADMTAASAYVWSRYALPALIEAPFSGPALDAASNAVMRFVLVNPGAFIAMRQDSKSLSLIIAAANGGLADYTSESRARPSGVDLALQTTSRAARKAIAHLLTIDKMQAHHLVPADVWKKNIDISTLALKDKWKPDSPTNLIALPSNAEVQAILGGTLPIHNSAHRLYNADTEAQITLARSQFSNPLTPLEAHAILDCVALNNRMRILLGVYGRIMRASQ